MGVASILRSGLTEQQAGNGAKEVPVKSMMNVITQGVGEIVEAQKAKSSVEMLRELIKTSEPPDSLAGLKHLKEAGLDLGTITSVQKETASMYRDLAAEEREARRLAQEAKEKAEERATTSQVELVKTWLEMQSKMSEMQIKELERKLEERGNRPPDPITQSVSEVIAEAVKRSLAQALTPQQPPKSPEEELFEKLSFADKVREYLGARQSSDDARALALSGQLKTEVLKLILEDEREREHLAEQRRLERERTEKINAIASALKENLADVVAAIGQTIAAAKTGATSAPQQPAYYPPPASPSDGQRGANIDL